MKTLRDVEDRLEDEHFSPEGGRSMYFLHHYLVIDSYVVEHPVWQLKPYFKGVVSLLKDHVAKWFFVIQDEITFIDALMLYVHDKDRLQKVEDFITEMRETTVARILSKNLQLLTDKQLADLAQYYCNQFKLTLKMAGTLRAVDRGVIALIKKDFSPDKKDEILRTISINTRQSTALQEEIALLKLAQSSISLSKEEVGLKLKEINSNFCFGVLGYYNEQPKTLEYYEKKFEEMKAGNPTEALKAIEDKLNKEKREKEEYVSTLPKGVEEVAHIAGSSTYLKDYYKYSINKVEYYGELIFKEISQRRNVSVSDLKDCTPHELVDIASGNPVDLNVVHERLAISAVFYYRMDDCLLLLEGNEARNFEEKYLLPNHGNAQEFKGRVACVGSAKGTAKVIIGPKDFHKMQKGDILVVINTSPDFVPIMHLASAIVSEEGGLTAHVSVVSREFGIPCVVGIRGITEVIKDGSVVEVDANTGVVKVIK
jgi:phosphoenolpyruvate synthase/pyruvate phosphate dikinase